MHRTPENRRGRYRTSVILGALGLSIAAEMDGLAWAHVIRDRDITFAVERSLSRDGMVPHDGIDVTTAQGIVTLAGTVPTLFAKEQAVRHAQSIKGVRAVVNTLEVRNSQRTDGEVAQDVSKALVIDPATDSFELSATASDGIVTLKGTVHSVVEKQLAESVIKGVKGVRGIRNEVQIKPTMVRADDEIESDINKRFSNDVYLVDDDLDIQVKDGAVVLSGTVGSALEKSRATTKAYVLGTKSVDDQKVAIKSGQGAQRTEYPHRTDAQIRRAIKDAFLYDPRVWSFNPEVRVKHGSVILSGIVEDLKAKKAAAADAQNTVGVRVVKNYLKVRPRVRPSDESLLANVRAALSRDPIVDRSQIRASLHGGTVWLYGTADSPAERRRAEDVVSGVMGVTAVKNHLVVHDDWTWTPDWEIKSEIEEQLWWSPFVDEEQVGVSVVDGTATLNGVVDNWWERKMATVNAFEGGAKSVRNHLAVAIN